MLCIHGFSAAPTNSPGGVKRVQKKPSLLTLELSREPTQQAYSEGSEDEDDCYSDDDFYSDEDEDDLYDLPASPSGTPCSAPIVIPSPRCVVTPVWQINDIISVLHAPMHSCAWV